MSCYCKDDCYDLGCYFQGDTIDTGLNATMGGDYIVRIPFAGIVIQTLLSLDFSDPIVFTHAYNEDYRFKFYILDPVGSIVTNPDGGDWFCFTSSIKVEV